MKKLLASIIFFAVVLASSVAATSTVLDEFTSESIATWTEYNSGYNPIVTRSEIVSPYDGSTAFKQEVSGNTVMYCDTKYISKDFEVGVANTASSNLQAYLAFTYDGTYYNFPYLQVYLYDQNGAYLTSKVFYGKDIVGGYYWDNYIQYDPVHYGELPGAAGFYTLDLSSLGALDYSKITVYLSDYTCVGYNSLVIDHLVFNSDGSNGGGDGQGSDVPEFGALSAFLVIAIAGVFVWRRHDE